MRLFRRRRSRQAAGEVARAAPADGSGPSADVSVTLIAGGPYPICSQCGRSQFPLAGDWEPPICQDCDAAINEDTARSEELDRP